MVSAARLSPTLNDRRLLLPGIVLLSLVAAAANRPDGPYGLWPGVAVHWLINLYFTTGYWLTNRALWMALLRRLPHVGQTARRLWLLTALALLLNPALTALLTLPMHLLLPVAFPLQLGVVLNEIRFSLVPTVAVLGLYETLYFFQQWQANVRRADQLARAETQARLEALQGQLDPHFLFNNLNTLAALIEPGNVPAQQFVEQLADVYRYVLLAQSRPTVPLAEEMAFVETYLALHKARFRDNLRVKIDLPAAALARHVAPLSVQLLIENALKHNVASQAHPLHLRLAVAEGFVVVENTLRPRPAGLAPGTGTGLENVRRRYELLGAPRPVEVQAAGSTFVVRLPLLPSPL